MKNMKVAKKLLVGFLIVALLCAVVGVVGIIGMLQINNSINNMYYAQTAPMQDMAKALEYQQRIRVGVRNAVLNTGDAVALVEDETTLIDREAQFEQFMANYYETITDPKAKQLIDDAMVRYEKEFKPVISEVLAGAKEGRSTSELMSTLGKATDASNMVVDNLTEAMDMKVAAAQNAYQASAVLFRTLLILIIIVIIIAVAVSMILAIYISGLISKPLKALSSFMGKAGSTGDITLRPEDKSVIDLYAKSKDEIGQAISGSSTFVEHVTNIAEDLQRVANGDLTANIKPLSSDDVMGNSLSNLLNNLNNMFKDINSASDQVSTGSVQIADGAQLLAQGATEQSATVEQLSASIVQISEQTKNNAGVANEAKDLGENIKVSAEQGNRQMEQMMVAVQEINESSKSIGKVIKIIDDIAFQTNILALNAAVEAARAGQHGKGFAVVADEVRSLAAKSAEAAKNTNELIESSIKKAEQGAAISAETASSLEQIVQGIIKTSELVSDISKSSDEQSIAINQISDAIGQVSQVVQQNSATAEESAAASEEMSGQATLLQQLIAQFKTKDSAMSASASFGPGAPSAESSYSPPAPSAGTGFSIGDKY
ncbi:MAG: methyl-accepting chemotaxis protein [Oscillospiraceae bacterium]|nr:methyl-accepting chemotaxis protein [Oscillospiraceae bacterium]